MLYLARARSASIKSKCEKECIGAESCPRAGPAAKTWRLIPCLRPHSDGVAEVIIGLPSHFQKGVVRCAEYNLQYALHRTLSYC